MNSPTSISILIAALSDVCFVDEGCLQEIGAGFTFFRCGKQSTDDNNGYFLKVVNDLFHSLSKGNIYVLALLDFSSAFDTIDHPILVHRLHTDFGFTDTVLQWFSSYLTDRTHYVSLSNH